MRTACTWLFAGVVASTMVMVMVLAGCELTTLEHSPASVPVKVLSAPALPPLVDPAVLATAVRAGVRQPDINQAVYEVDTFLVALTVEDLSSGRPSVSFEPVTEGVPGQRIRGVREGSVYAALGLLDGDIIESINGVPLDGPGQALAGLGEGDRGVVLQVSRANVSAARELRFVGGLAWSHVIANRTGAPLPADAPAVIADPVFPDMPSAPAPGAAPEPAGRPAPRGARAEDASPPAATKSPAPAASSIQCGLDGICSVARRDFDAAVADPDKLLRQVSVSEARGGYKLDQIRSGSQVSQLGFRNGDVIISVNGVQLDDSLGLLGLYGGLATTSSYKVVYERAGARRGKVVRLRE